MGGPCFRAGLRTLMSTWRILRVVTLLFVTSLRCPKTLRTYANGSVPGSIIRTVELHHLSYAKDRLDELLA